MTSITSATSAPGWTSCCWSARPSTRWACRSAWAPGCSACPAGSRSRARWAWAWRARSVSPRDCRASGAASAPRDSHGALTRPRSPDLARSQGGLAVAFISVIVPVRNEARCVRHTLEQLLAQDYPAGRFEVLVADGRSTDATRDIVRAVAARHGNVRLLDNPGGWSSAGRNVAVRAARGDILLLVDGHCELGNPNYLADLAAAFARSGADCVGRPQPLDVAHASALQRAVAAARSSPLGHNPASFIYSSFEGFVKPQSVAVAYR